MQIHQSAVIISQPDMMTIYCHVFKQSPLLVLYILPYRSFYNVHFSCFQGKKSPFRYSKRKFHCLNIKKHCPAILLHAKQLRFVEYLKFRGSMTAMNIHVCYIITTLTDRPTDRQIVANFAIEILDHKH